MEKVYTVRFETKAWYEAEVIASSETEAIDAIKEAPTEELGLKEAGFTLEDEDMTPLDVQVVNEAPCYEN